jgi:predicted MFS family arabinose efflux permease
MGSFCGVWLGGYLYDKTGSYQVVWMIAIALGVFAALINWPIHEKPVARLAAA